MKKRVISAAVILALFVTASLAAGTFKTIKVEYGVKLTVDGKAITMKDANGNVVEPFVYNGTTYLPVRGVADAVGKTVSYDAATNTVVLGAVAKKSDVLLEQNGIKITYTGLDTKSHDYKTSIKLLIENNADCNYTIQVRNVSVNGFMLDPIFSCDVAAGKKANASIGFYNSELTKNGITSMQTVELNFHVFGENSENRFDSEIIKINA